MAEGSRVRGCPTSDSKPVSYQLFARKPQHPERSRRATHNPEPRTLNRYYLLYLLAEIWYTYKLSKVYQKEVALRSGAFNFKTCSGSAIFYIYAGLF
jgi:hypothetical protein